MYALAHTVGRLGGCGTQWPTLAVGRGCVATRPLCKFRRIMSRPLRQGATRLCLIAYGMVLRDARMARIGMCFGARSARRRGRPLLLTCARSTMWHTLAHTCVLGLFHKLPITTTAEHACNAHTQMHVRHLHTGPRCRATPVHADVAPAQ